MNLSPLLLNNLAPTERDRSVTRTFEPRIDVGWNCINSISFNNAPALYANAKPSPVHTFELVVFLYRKPAGPVANIVA